MRALLCWIGVVLFAMLGIGGLLVAVSNLALAPAGVGLAALLAGLWCWALARRLSAGQLASASGRATARQDEDDDDNRGGFASALLASGLQALPTGSSQATFTPRTETTYEPLACKADSADGDTDNDQDRSDDCGSNDSDTGSDDSSDSGSDNSSSD